MNWLSWITAAVKGAVLKGFQEAAEELELTHAPGDETALVALKGRMAALPSPSSNGDDAEIANGHIKGGRGKK